ncbi:phage tail terminator-like protein [Bradyrhizobium liaoningense]
MSAVGTDALISEALLTRLAALTFSPALQVAWPNKTFGPDKPDTYLQASLLRAETQGIGISAWNEHAGILQVDVLYKPADGEIKPLNIADAVAAWFGRGTRLRNGGLTIFVDDPPAIASSMPNGDGYLKIPVSIRYRSFVR